MGLLSKINKFAHVVGQDTSKVLSTVYTDVKSGAKSVGLTAEHVVTSSVDSTKNLISAGEHVLDKGLDTVGGLGKSLSFPLLIVGGAVGIYLLTRR
jgi:hypothetical protein